MKLYILTLHWNSKDKLKRLHDTLIPSLNGFNYKWLIKDNGSSDGSKEYITSILSDNIECYFTGHNRDTFASGMNILFEKTGAEDNDLILLINNDVWFGDNKSISNMVKIIESDNDVGLVGARLLYPDGKRLQHAGVYFSKRYGYLPYHYRHKEMADNESKKNKEFQAVTAALALTRAKYYKNIFNNNKSNRPGMDEIFFFLVL